MGCMPVISTVYVYYYTIVSLFVKLNKILKFFLFAGTILLS